MEERVKELSKYRFETSLENLEDAQKQIARAEEFSGAIKVYLTEQGIIREDSFSNSL